MKQIIVIALLLMCASLGYAQRKNNNGSVTNQRRTTVSKQSNTQQSTDKRKEVARHQIQASPNVQSLTIQSTTSENATNDADKQRINNTTTKTKTEFSRYEVVGDFVLGSANDYAELAKKYRDASQDAVGQIENIYKAIFVYDEMKTKYPNTADYANFMAARTIHVLDPDQKQGLAKPYYEALFESFSASGIKDTFDRTRLIEACRYLGIYYFKIKNDNASAKPYFLKLQEVDPDDMLAKQVLGVLE